MPIPQGFNKPDDDFYCSDSVWRKIYDSMNQSEGIPVIYAKWKGSHRKSYVIKVFIIASAAKAYFDKNGIVGGSTTNVSQSVRKLDTDRSKIFFLFSVRMVNEPIIVTKNGVDIPYDNFWAAMKGTKKKPDVLYSHLLDEGTPNY